MNNKYLAIMIIILTTSNLYSQEMLKVGNLWNYESYDWDNDTFTSTVCTVKGDTIISDNVYKNILVLTIDPNNQEKEENYFVRENDDGEIFKLDSNLNEVVLFDSKMLQGETFNVNIDCEFSSPTMQIEVLNNGEEVTKIYYDYINSNPTSDSTIISSINGFQWLEKVGNLKIPFYGPSETCPMDYPIINSALTCYYSENELIYGNENLCAGLVNSIDKENELNLSIYPNPFLDLLTINLSDSHKKIKNIMISDMYGKIVFHLDDIDEHSPQIDTKLFPSGMYSLNITTLSGTQTSHKIVKL